MTSITKSISTTENNHADDLDSDSDNEGSPDDPSQHTYTLTPALLSTINPTIGSVKSSIRHTSRSLKNRLLSITADSVFALAVSTAYSLPLIPNSRAGDWYVPPRRRHASAYFKSTDGHPGQWSFSLRRLNLGVLDCLAKNAGEGVVLVDSTRRGKRFPDSLSRTVPVWIAVVNSVMFGRAELFTSPTMVGDGEKAAMEELIPGFVERFLELKVDLTPYAKAIRKPLRPIWTSPDSTLPSAPPVFEDFAPVVCLTASRMVQSEGIEGEYIQGAGDDHEGWASESGLTPTLFWAHHAGITSTPEDLLQEVIRTLKPPEEIPVISRVGNTNIHIAPTSALPSLSAFFDSVICTSPSRPDGVIHHYPIPAKPAGAKLLRRALPDMVSKMAHSAGKTLIACETGNEVAPCVALALLCLFYDDDGEYRALENRSVVDKVYVRKRLAWVAAAREGVNPARVFLNVVNRFLMERVR